MLPIAMITGTLTYSWVSRLAPLTPWLIFIMLLVTFCKLSPREIRLKPTHVWLLLIQLIGSAVIYLVLVRFNVIIAEGVLICVLAPTATAAAVITGMLGGSVGFLTTYLLLCNIGIVIMAPLLFSFWGIHSDMPFIDSFLYICRQVGLILMVPLLLAWLIRYTLPKIHTAITSVSGLSFYLWAISLTIVTGNTVKFLVTQDTPDYKVEIGLAIISLIICVAQFIIGRRIGWRYNDPVSSGQGLGQKNTILAIWMAQVYLNPVSSVAPAAYVLWQNIINSYQLWLKGKKNKQQNK
ncbi:MAG: transporter [Tannerellaceae bacterium]|nr:transporter [Tannerellaceae bacterium]